MPRVDFTIVNTGDGSNFTETLIAGSLSGSGSRFLRVGSTTIAGVRRYLANGISIEDSIVEMFHVHPSPSGTAIGAEFLARVQSLSPLTAYAVGVGGTAGGGDQYQIIRYNAGVPTTLVGSGGGTAPNSVTLRSRFIVKGAVLIVQRFVSGIWTDQIVFLDATPLVGVGGVGFGAAGSTGMSNLDLDDWRAFKAV